MYYFASRSVSRYTSTIKFLKEKVYNFARKNLSLKKLCETDINGFVEMKGNECT